MEFHQECEWQMHGNEHSNIWVNDGKWRVPDLGKPYALLGGGVSLNSSGHCILHSLFTLLTEGVGPQGKAHHDEQIRKIWNLVERCQQRQPQMLHPAGRVRCLPPSSRRNNLLPRTSCFQEEWPKVDQTTCSFQASPWGHQALGHRDLVDRTFPTAMPQGQVAVWYGSAILELPVAVAETRWPDDWKLVGGLEHGFLWLSIILGISSSQLTNSIIFQRGRAKKHQPAICSYMFPWFMGKMSHISICFPIPPWFSTRKLWCDWFFSVPISSWVISSYVSLALAAWNPSLYWLLMVIPRDSYDIYIVY